MSDQAATNPAKPTAAVGLAYEQRFHELVATWKRERGPHSSSARLAEHPAYQQIIRLGPEVVPSCCMNWRGSRIIGSGHSTP